MNAPIGSSYAGNCPWERPDVISLTCTNCNGAGHTYSYEDENDPECMPEKDDCTRCEGTGQIDNY